MTSLPGDLSEQQWRRARVIFDKIQAAPPNERSRVLEQMCNGDSALLEELRSLLEACEAEETLSDSLADWASSETNDPAQRSVGPYELDCLLGRGGMGAVYLAHRADGQFRQQVAIKLIDVPIASELFRRQFRLERQILAGLSHPSIARLLDGGVTADGELYLAMAYIDGIPILDYCKQNRVSLRARLLLFNKVCSAVQYAHQNLVIHRDLKPANILVDSEGTPHLLDFGTAKLLSPLQEGNEGDLTSHGLRSFTPQYASPEQVLGKTVSTASDIYSLGVILFELLADVPPYLLHEKNMAEMLRLICETQPPKPSAVAASAEKLDADLDSIAFMALRKEPSERYLTVQQFAGDIQAWLDGRPVLARRGTLRYRALKFAKRNKLALSAGALLFAAIVCGMAGILSQSRVANLQRIRAEASTQEMRQMSNSLLSEIDNAVKELPGSTPVRQLIVKNALEHLDHIRLDGNEDRLTYLYLANAYTSLGNLQGDPHEQNIGDSTGALASLGKALTIAYQLEARFPGDLEAKRALAIALKTESNVLFGIGRTKEAVVAMQKSIDILNSQLANRCGTPAQFADVADSYRELGDEFGLPSVASLGDTSKALSAYRLSYEFSDRALRLDPQFGRVKRQIALYYFKVGNILTLTDPEEAIKQYRASLADWENIRPIERSDKSSKRAMTYISIELGSALTEARKHTAAIAAFEGARSAVQFDAAMNPADAQAQFDLASLLEGEAETYIDMSDPILNPKGGYDRATNLNRATSLVQKSLQILTRLLGTDPNNQTWLSYSAYEEVLLGSFNRSMFGKSGESLATVGITALRFATTSPNASNDLLSHAASAMLSVHPLRLRNSVFAVQYAERLVSASHRKEPNSLLILAEAYLQNGQIESAARTAHEGLGHLAPQRAGVPAVRCRVLLEHVLATILNRQKHPTSRAKTLSESAKAG